eukprot:scaffold46961_cov191-Amphora_coffeaeformis.AAC.1
MVAALPYHYYFPLFVVAVVVLPLVARPASVDSVPNPWLHLANARWMPFAMLLVRPGHHNNVDFYYYYLWWYPSDGSENSRLLRPAPYLSLDVCVTAHARYDCAASAWKLSPAIYCAIESEGEREQCVCMCRRERPLKDTPTRRLPTLAVTPTTACAACVAGSLSFVNRRTYLFAHMALFRRSILNISMKEPPGWMSTQVLLKKCFTPISIHPDAPWPPTVDGEPKLPGRYVGGVRGAISVCELESSRAFCFRSSLHVFLFKM